MLNTNLPNTNSRNDNDKRIKSLEELLLRSITKNRENTVDRYNQQMANIKTYLWLATALFAAIYYVFSNDIKLIVSCLSFNTTETKVLLADWTFILCSASILCCAYVYSIGVKEISGDELEVHTDLYYSYLKEKLSVEPKDFNLQEESKQSSPTMEGSPSPQNTKKRKLKTSSERGTETSKNINKESRKEVINNSSSANESLINADDYTFPNAKYAHYLAKTIIQLRDANASFQDNISRRGSNMQKMNDFIILGSIYFFLSLICFHSLKLT